jgi:hypothetical protein
MYEAPKQRYLEGGIPLSFNYLVWGARDARLTARFPKSVGIVFNYLVSRASYEAGRWTCFPSYDLMSRDTGISVRHLTRIIKILVKHHLIHCLYRTDTSNLYTINAVKIWTTARVEQEKERVLAQEKEARERAAVHFDGEEPEAYEPNTKTSKAKADVTDIILSGDDKPQQTGPTPAVKSAEPSPTTPSPAEAASNDDGTYWALAGRAVNDIDEPDDDDPDEESFNEGSGE